MDYLTWIKILAMAVRLVQEPAFEKEFRVQAGWSSADKINPGGKTRTGILCIDIYRAGSKDKLKSFVFVPWDDAYVGNDLTGDLPGSLSDRVYTVTPFAVVYEIFHKYDLSPEEEGVLGIFISVFDRLIGYEYCNGVTEKDGGFTMPGQLQVIDLKEYRYYTEIRAAIPGSRPVSPDTLAGLFPGKMIYLVMVPDMGASRKQWIRGTGPDFKPYFDNVKEELTKFLPDTVKKYELLFSAQPQTDEAAHNKVLADPDDLKKEQDKDREDSASIPQNLPGYGMDELFPDYTPKLTPDDVIDYMPSLAGEMENLPEVTATNLPQYIVLLRHYRKQARRQPGEWTEAIPILGAAEKEYNPSPAELMLSETGERIRLITEQDRAGIEQTLAQHHIRTRKITYRKYSFIHYDVMGSGRFFYAIDTGEVTVKLPDKDL